MLIFETCKREGCCPEVHFTNGKFIIGETGNEVTLEPKYFREIVEAAKEGKFDSILSTCQKDS